MSIKITSSDAKKLQSLQSGAELKKSEVSQRLLRLLQENHAIILLTNGSGRGRVKAREPEFTRFVKNVLRIQSLAALANLSESATRTELASITSNSKSKTLHPMQGCFLRARGDAAIEIRGTIHSNHSEGISLLVTKREMSSIRINSEWLVGVENADTFLRAEMLFENLPQSVVFFLRGNHKELIQITPKEQKFAYIGDYDIAGLAIFKDSFLSHFPESRFLIPEHLEDMMKNGLSSLYQEQERLLNGLMDCPHQDVKTVLGLIRKYRKGLEQECLEDACLKIR